MLVNITAGRRMGRAPSIRFLLGYAALIGPLFLQNRGRNMDASNALLMTLGAASLLVSWILLLTVSWREDYAWGLFSLLLPPVGYFYGLFQWNKAGQALLVAFLGWALIILGW
jgi:hypothetical protein